MKLLKLIPMALLLFSIDSHGLEAPINPNSLVDSFHSKPGTLARAIEENNLDAFQEFLLDKGMDVTNKDINIDFNQECNLERYGLNNGSNGIFSMIDTAAFFDSTKIFNYLILNDHQLTDQTMNLSIMYHHEGYQIFKFCLENGQKPNNDTLNYAFKNFDIDLVQYIFENYPDQYTFTYADKPLFCHALDFTDINPSLLHCKKFKELSEEIAKIYPVVFESFLEDDLNTSEKIEKAIDKTIVVNLNFFLRIMLKTLC